MLRAMLMVFCLLLAAPASASPEGDRAGDIADQLESPFCPGRTISACTSPAAAKWRVDIQTWVNAGVPTEEIRARLSEQAGRDLRFVPQDDTFYGLLALGAAASLGVIGFITHRVRRRDESALTHGETEELDADQDAAWDERLDAELAYED